MWLVWCPWVLVHPEPSMNQVCSILALCLFALVWCSWVPMLSWTQHEPSLQHPYSVFICIGVVFLSPHAILDPAWTKFAAPLLRVYPRLSPSAFLPALRLPHLVHNAVVCTPVFVPIGNLYTYGSVRCYFLDILFLCLLTYSYFLFISLPLSWSDHRYNAKQYT